MASRQYEQLEENIVQKNNRQQSAKSCSCSTSVSGYSSCDRDDEFDVAILGTTKNRGRNINRARETKLEEKHATKISKHIGLYWQSLGRQLQFTQDSLDNILVDHSNNEDRALALLIKYIRQQGSAATNLKLADALVSIGRTDTAEKIIGDKWEIPQETQHQQTFHLTEEGRFNLNTHNDPISFIICRNKDGRLFLVRELNGSGYERACKTLKEEDGIAVNLLKALDPWGIVETERERKIKEEIAVAQAKLVEFENDLKMIQNSLEAQERQEDRIEVGKQLVEDEKLTGDMQMICTKLVQLTGNVGHLKEPSSMKIQLYNFSIGLTASHRDLQDRIKMLLDMATRNKMLLDANETWRLSKLLKRCRSLGLEIKLREKSFSTRFKELTLEGQQRQHSPSDPTPISTGLPIEVTGIRRASTQPVSGSELRSLAEDVSPPDAQFEHETAEDIWSTDC